MALKLLALGLLFLAAFAAAEVESDSEFATSDSSVERASRKKANKSFDFFYFVQQWPGSFCDTSKGCCFPVTGEPGAEFGIHGLWPNRNDGTWPASCTNEEFDESEFKDVLANMNTDWGTLACSSSHNEDFWEHEWSKHGTCSGLSQHDYFQRSIDLYNDYDITGALANAGIVPDDSFYPITKISQAFKDVLGFAPQIECNKDPQGNKQLYQVYICVAKDAKTLIKCPAAISNPCQGNVQFPVFDASSSKNDETATSTGSEEL